MGAPPWARGAASPTMRGMALPHAALALLLPAVLPQTSPEDLTERFVAHFLGKIFDNPQAVFTPAILRPETHAWVGENILYKVPNQAAMEALDPSLIESFPNLGITPAELFEGEELVDLGEAAPLYTQIATEIAAQ